MDKLGQINLKSTMTVQISCNLNEEILINNFNIITQCLKDLSANQSAYERQLKDLSSLREQMKDLTDKLNNQNNTHTEKKQTSKEAAQKSITDDSARKEIEKNIDSKHNSQTNIERGDNLNNNQEKSPSDGKNNRSHDKQGTQSGRQNNQSSETNKKDHQSDKNMKNSTNLSTKDGDIAKLKERVSKNQGNIIDNIRDINTVLKEMKEIKQLLGSIDKTNGQPKRNQKLEQQQKGATFDIASISNIHQQMNKDKEEISKLNQQLQVIKQRIAQNEKDISDLKDRSTENKQVVDKDQNGNTNANINGNTTQQSNSLHRQVQDLKDKIDILSKKLANNVQNTNNNTNDIENLKEDTEQLKKQNEQRIKQIQQLRECIDKFNKEIQNLKDLTDNNSKTLKNEILKIKKNDGKNKDSEGESYNKKIKSNTSFQDEGNQDKNPPSGPKNAIYTQNRFNLHHDDKDAIRELRERVDMLQKLMGGSKNLIGEEKSSQDKLPVIRKAFKQRQRDSSTYEKTNYNPKRDLNELKTEIQAWVKNFYEQGKEKDNLQSLQLQIQEIRNILNRKADQEGMKKGLSFLENKITQLYLFLTEPDTEDAMIVRKGFNCLSCSKKVQKLRGKLGPHLNWNNMTQTNYSPPRVGYSKPIGENSIDKDDQ